MIAQDHQNDQDVVIVAAARTPQGRLKGQLASFTAPQLGAFAIKGALEQGSVDPSEVDAVIVGMPRSSRCTVTDFSRPFSDTSPEVCGNER